MIGIRQCGVTYRSKLRIELIGHDILVVIKKACKYPFIKPRVRHRKTMFLGLDTKAKRTNPLDELFWVYDCGGLDSR